MATFPFHHYWLFLPIGSWAATVRMVIVPPRHPKNVAMTKSIQIYTKKWHFLLYLVLYTTPLTEIDGASIPPIFWKSTSGSRARRDNDSDHNTTKLLSESDSSAFPLQKRRNFGDILGKIRNHRVWKVVDHEDDNLTQLPTQQLSMPLPSLILAAASKSFGFNHNGGRFLKAVLQNPKWLLMGGAIYQGQKAIRSEAVRRAARFWVKIGPVVAHYKFTRWWLKHTNAPLEHRDAVYGVLHEKYAPITMKVALDLKGLYVKLAQVVSSRPDFVPLAYIRLFVAAQDSLPQWPIEEIKELIDNSLLQTNSTDILSFETVFEDIDAIALGSASIGQCHRARIRGKFAKDFLEERSNDNGGNLDNDDDLPSVDVAVKVQHPGSEERFKHDFSVFRWLCKVALTGWEPILDELYRQIMSEFDYCREAGSLERVRRNMLSSPFSKSVKIPKPIPGLCSKELLVMELLEGPKLSDSLEDELKEILGEDRSKRLLDRKRLELVLGKDKLESLESSSNSRGENENSSNKPLAEQNLLQDLSWATKLQLLGLYRRAQNTIDKLVDVQGYQMLKDGVFQGDPHPGNILELSKANRKSRKKSITNFLGNSSSILGLIDYGQTKIITDKERLGVAKVILALGEKPPESATDNTEAVANAMRDLGFCTKRNDSKVLAQYAGLFFDSDEVGKELYNCPTPQTYFKLLTELDPLVEVPDVAIFVARCGFILRGMGSILGKQIKTSQRWSVYAKEAIDEAEQNEL